jgi:hypothetical protein
LFSKVWALREAAIIKIRLLLRSNFVTNPGLSVSLGPLAATIKLGVNDKIAQVFAASIGLLDDLIANVTRSVRWIADYLLTFTLQRASPSCHCCSTNGSHLRSVIALLSPSMVTRRAD